MNDQTCNTCGAAAGKTCDGYCREHCPAGHLPDIHEGGSGCDIGCEGLFVDGETLAVTRCDTCERFESDEDAAACVDTLINLLYAVHVDSKAATVADALDELVKRAGVLPFGEDKRGQAHQPEREDGA